MDTFINLTLLSCGFLGALAAFGGKTWREADEPLLKRVTKRGWFSLGLLVLALIIGVVKEVRTNTAAQQGAMKRERLEQELRDTNKQLRETDQALRKANLQLAKMAPQVAAIPQQVYSIGQSFEPNESRPLRRQLYGGDKVEYDGDCEQLYLVIAGRSYYLDPRKPVRIIEGRVGEPMTAIIENRSDRQCGLKLNVLSVEQALR